MTAGGLKRGCRPLHSLFSNKHKLHTPNEPTRCAWLWLPPHHQQSSPSVMLSAQPSSVRCRGTRLNANKTIQPRRVVARRAVMAPTQVSQQVERDEPETGPRVHVDGIMMQGAAFNALCTLARARGAESAIRAAAKKSSSKTSSCAGFNWESHKRHPYYNHLADKIPDLQVRSGPVSQGGTWPAYRTQTAMPCHSARRRQTTHPSPTAAAFPPSLLVRRQRACRTCGCPHPRSLCPLRATCLASCTSWTQTTAASSSCQSCWQS